MGGLLDAQGLYFHQRIGFRRPSGQGLRPDLGCHSRRLHRQRRQARPCRRQPCQHPAGLRDAGHHQQDRHCRRRPRFCALHAQVRQAHDRQPRGAYRDRPRSRARHRLRPGRLLLPRRRCRGAAARPVARHRHGRRRQEEGRQSRRAGGRGRPGPDVRLRLPRQRGIREGLVHAGPDLFLAQDPRGVEQGPPFRRAARPAARRQEPGHRALRQR